MVTLIAYAVGSISMAVAAIWSAWSTHERYYQISQHLVSSKISFLVLANLAICITILFGKLLVWTFLAKLRDLEVEHLYEKLAFTITESMLAVAMFRDEINVDLFAMLTVVLFMKIFHWVTSDRVDFVPQSPGISIWTIVRLSTLLFGLFVADVVFLLITLHSVFTTGFSMMVLFGFEFVVLAATMCSITSKFVLHVIDLSYLDGSWERKGAFIFYIELVTDLVNLITYIFFFASIMLRIGIPIHIIRDIYLTFRNIQRRLKDLLRYRRATANMDLRYPDATADELEALTDRTCIVCRDDMAEGKKLPCGHILHLRCLRSWLERQQTCPICRTDVLTTPTPDPPPVTPPPVDPPLPPPPLFPPPPTPTPAVHTPSSSALRPPPMPPLGFPLPPSPMSSLPPISMIENVSLDVLERLIDEANARKKLVESELGVLNAVLQARRET